MPFLSLHRSPTGISTGGGVSVLNSEIILLSEGMLSHISRIIDIVLWRLSYYVMKIDYRPRDLSFPAIRQVGPRAFLPIRSI